ncbi:MAG: ABC transporter substrate-binding protein [Pyrinomonadaceae bacterium]|nr:ABC transporter substrate-binding protein [Pyrinomonadaceae bacterium]
MKRSSRFVLTVITLLFVVSGLLSCSRRGSEFVVALDTAPTLDPFRGSNAASYRMQQLMFNTLVKKNERFEYVGELASNFQPSADNLSYTFTLHDNVKFHDGRPLTSSDVKYTFDTLLASDASKAGSFMKGTGESKQKRIQSIEAPDPRTVVMRLSEPWTELLANLVAVPIIPPDSSANQENAPMGSGPFRFVRKDESQQVYDLEAHENYWEGAPQIKRLRVRVILDANTLQAELRSGRVDLAPNVTNFTPDAYNSLKADANLQVKQFPGANVAYLSFNTKAEPLSDARVRRAIAMAIDREGIVRDLLLGQAQIAHSILPETSWAYTPGDKIAYDPQAARRLLDEAGFRDPDGNGNQMRFPRPLVFKILGSSVAISRYASVIQNAIKEIGVPVEIETMELQALLEAQSRGQYQLSAGSWVGGNQDPIFLRDLFTPTRFNRTQYSNPDIERILAEATTTTDRERARALYAEAQSIVTRDMPMLPLWYPANMIIARKSVGNIEVDPSGDWRFIRKLTLENN